ncbi:lipase-like PAD4 isoform X2 [Neltuma alba]|uniref:lipase-like PAD4 isoform X2 n=1 Tax=Neltuma alba TaxID=207710 RepID=UPI0010A57D05|nr:lipase-like PAD4 isoform X2 [Prosopis alba]
MPTKLRRKFETSEMLATFLASTPLLSESWKLCSLANTAAPWSFVTERIGSVVYVAFSGVQMAGGSDASWWSPVALDSIGDVALFSSRRNIEGGEPAMVYAGMLNLFQSLFHSLQNQMFAIIKSTDAKSIVITGHSLGGAIASLSTIWFLSCLRSISSAISVLCITFGSPLLGNKSLSQAILKERWGGNFCHVVSNHDIMPRMLFAPLQPPLTAHLNFLLQFWHLSMASLELRRVAVQISEPDIADLFSFVVACLGAAAKPDGEGSSQISFHPFGSYVFASEKGAVCVDSATTVIQMMHFMFAPSSPACSIDDHLKYGDYVNHLSLQAFKRNCEQANISDSSYEAGLELALKSSGVPSQGSVAMPIKECLRMARRMGRSPSLKHASLAVTLSKFVPYRAEIEWYKSLCDQADDQLGYYDSFKRRGSSRRGMKINMNRLKLARFWNNVIDMMESNQLPYDFDRSRKWVNSSQFYKLLVEPLDIAEYYRKGMHRTKGHYIQHGRERRYEIFDRWWKDRTPSAAEGNHVRSTFASLTQDTCFWARVEEARDWLDSVRSEIDISKEAHLWDNIEKFENYAAQLIENKEVSKDVLAKNSSYSVWVEELRELREMKAKVQNFPYQFTRFVNGGVVP